jgi:hypothetical protein
VPRKSVSDFARDALVERRAFGAIIGIGIVRVTRSFVHTAALLDRLSLERSFTDQLIPIDRNTL